MRTTRAPDLTVLFDADCGFCGRSAMLVHRLDRARRIRFLPLQRAADTIEGAPDLDQLSGSIHVVDARGRWSKGGAAWLTTMDLVPALRPLAMIARLPGLRTFIEPVYDIIAAHRHQLGRLLGADACRYTPPERPEAIP